MDIKKALDDMKEPDADIDEVFIQRCIKFAPLLADPAPAVVVALARALLNARRRIEELEAEKKDGSRA